MKKIQCLGRSLLSIQEPQSDAHEEESKTKTVRNPAASRTDGEDGQAQNKSKQRMSDLAKNPTFSASRTSPTGCVGK